MTRHARQSDASSGWFARFNSKRCQKQKKNVHSFSDYTIHTHRFLKPRAKPNVNLYIFKIHIVVGEANIDLFMNL